MAKVILSRKKLSIGRLLFTSGVLIWSLGFGGAIPVIASHITDLEIERYVRARIDIGEAMRNFFRDRKPPQFGPEGGPSIEELRKLEDEINAHLSEVLSKHDLTIEQYQENSPEVFTEEEGVRAFLAAHPDLQKRYETLPKSPPRARHDR